MIANLLGGSSNSLLILTSLFFVCVLTALGLSVGKRFLPVDEGRKFAHDGALSKGKPRGAGLVFVITLVVSAILFVPLSIEIGLYLALVVAAMLTGYFDDASSTPWGPLKKGLLDFAIAVITSITYVNFNGSTLNFAPFGGTIELYPVVFVILGAVLVWVAINVTNCSDGVDGLSGTLVLITLVSFVMYGESAQGAEFRLLSLLLMGAIIVYLWFNATPSILMMGDAGSRSLGLFLAIAAMKSGNALLFIPFALMLIIDGGAGLIKLSFGRFLKLKIMKNIRTPIHDHCRKNKDWSNTQVVSRFAIIQIFVSFLVCMAVK